MNQTDFTNHYEHKDHVDLIENYCYYCDVDLSLDHDRAIIERFFTPSSTDTHLETEVLSEDPEMGLDELYSGTTPESLDELAGEMLAEMGACR